LLRDYADQFEQATLARIRLVALDKPGGAGQEEMLVTRQVWSTPDMGNIEGAPSPDGRFLSFVDWDTGDLAIRDLDAGTTRRLTNKGSWEKSEEFAMFSRWSPDGKLLAYDWFDGDSYDLHVIAREGGDPRVLVDHEHDEWIQTYDWSPDGKQILIGLAKEDGTTQTVLVSAADGATKVVKTFQKHEFSPGYPEVARFSRDGQYIAYNLRQKKSSSEHDIFLITIDGSREVRLVAHPADDLFFGWSPDGKGILFASDRTGSLDMWFLPVSGGKAQGAPVLVKTGMERSVPFGFTQDGSFYYTQGQGRWMYDVYDARVDFQSGRILEPPELLIKHHQGRNSWPE
jgi:Tol biopolymer transport system component